MIRVREGKAPRGVSVEFKWNGIYYGYAQRKIKNGSKGVYYKASKPDFSDAEEIPADEYFQVAKKYNDIIGFN